LRLCALAVKFLGETLYSKSCSIFSKMKNITAKSQSRREAQLFDLSAFASLRFILFVLIIFQFSSLYSQESPASEITKAEKIIKDRGEVVLKFAKPSNISMFQITRMLSIDKVKNDSIYAYLNRKEFATFLKLKINFDVVETPQIVRTLKSSGSIWDWNKYPTYSEYLAMMDSFARAYPSLCKIIDAGKSVKGHNILFARISSDTTRLKPKVMFSSSMHGNELVGYVLMLRLIEYLLKNYNSNSTVTTLVDSLEIWINPLANPDATYKGGDNDVWHATYFNADSINLNRNFPDPVEGPHPDGDAVYEPETKAMMALMNKYNYILSANFHSGSEVVNYPWDSRPEMHPDSTWFRYISHEYADTAQFYGRPGYFTDVDPSGITDGWAWYAVFGGRQDYITYFHNGREVTIEIDETKMTPESELDNLWNYNYRSFLHYLQHAIYGIGKIVKTSIKSGLSENESEIGIYPNPCNQFFLIKGLDKQPNKIDIIITDISGKLVRIISKINSDEPVFVDDLFSGIYYVTINADAILYRKKIIIEK
jgi:Zinc carboxypeptidase/Secretion system C-terminal sorting domain